MGVVERSGRKGLGVGRALSSTTRSLGADHAAHLSPEFRVAQGLVPRLKTEGDPFRSVLVTASRDSYASHVISRTKWPKDPKLRGPKPRFLEPWLPLHQEI